MTDQDTTLAPADPGGSDEWFSADNSTFGDRLAGAREAAGMSRGDLARRLGVKVGTVEKWEDDLSEPRANRLQMLSGILGVSLAWLLTAQGEGVDPPAIEDGAGADAAALLADLRHLKADLQRMTERTAVMEKRLRHILSVSA